MGEPTVMPITGSILMGEVPFAMLVPHEAQARANHGQSLGQLAERGGLSCCEALAILEDRRWSWMGETDAARDLINKVREWRAARTTGATNG